jgi:hypothetical protein
MLLAAALSTAMILVATQLAPVWSSLLQQRQAAHEMASLEALETFRLSAKFDEWLARGERGLAWTVRALVSSRPGVSYAAEQALLGEVDSWRSKSRGEVLPRMVAIAHELARVADHLPASRRPLVRRLVQRFAETQSGDARVDGELLAACDRILAQLPPASPEELLLAERERAASEQARIAKSLEAAPAANEPIASPPLEPNELDVMPPEDLPPGDVDEDGNKLKSPTKKVPKRFFAPRAQELPSTPVNVPENAPLLLPPDQTAKKTVVEWIAELGDLEVMRLLHHGDYGVRYTAERELDRRGYAREHLIIAKQLVHPDPRERRQLAEQLPRMTDIDPRPWLLQLSEDEDVSVRRTAEGILQASRPGRETR